MKNLFLLLISLLLYGQLIAWEKRDLLQQKASEINLTKALLKDFSEIGFPDYSSRDFWEKLPVEMRQEYINEAEKYLDYDWPVVKATDYRSEERRVGKDCRT